MNQRTISIFFSCADQDATLCRELEAQLAIASGNRVIEIWHSGKLLPGQDSLNEGKKHFEKADIILLFISPDFFLDPICVEQMNDALHRNQTVGTQVIPIIIRPIDWRSSAIGRLAPLPAHGNPLTSVSREAALLEIAQGIKTVIASITPSVSPAQTSASLSLGGNVISLDRVRGFAMATNFVGRTEELERLHSNFQNPDKYLFIIGGLIGMGKTTLAARFATEIAKAYNVIWFNCRDMTVTANILLREIGRIASHDYKQPLLLASLENPAIHADAREEALFQVLAQINRAEPEIKSRTVRKPIALFLDEYHEVTDPALNRLVLNIAKNRVGTKVVLTLRQTPLDFEREIGLVTRIILRGLSEASCQQLLESYAESYPALEALEEDEEMAARIWERTRGVPAALKFLISMTEYIPLENVLEQLPGNNEDALTEMMKRLCEGSFHALSEEERQVAMAASIFRRPMALGPLLAVSQDPQTNQIIIRLINRFILAFDGRQYSMNVLLADYARSLLSPLQAKEFHHRAAIFYATYQDKKPDPTERLLRQQESCYHFIKAEEMEQAETVLTTIAASLRDEGFFQEFFDILDQLEQEGRVLVPDLTYEKAVMLYKRGKVNQAIALLEQLDGATDAPIEVKIKAQQQLGWIFIETGKREEAKNYLEQSRELAKREKLSQLEAEALSRLQHVAYHQCDYDQALAYNSERISLLERMRDEGQTRDEREKIKEEIRWTQHEIANVHRERGELEEALELYNEGLDFWRKRKSPGEKVGWIRYDIGQIYRDKGMFQEAYKQFELAFEIFRKMPHLYGQAHTEIELGRVGCKLGKKDAMQFVQRAIKTLQKVKGVSGVAYGMGALGQIYLWSGQLESALKQFQESKEKEDELKSTKGSAWSLHQISLVYLAQGRHLLQTGKPTAALPHFLQAQDAIIEAKRLFALIGTVPNVHGIQDDARNIAEQLASCQGSL
ncbi:MAG TPA: tetratricopeptide repeat protein [Ktedonobacteraceae bacterium]|nr:tetratricopeptide repeat protein [Ktedonobacteraceae bacterium]